MNGIIGTFRIGEDISLGLDAVTGDPAAVTAISAKMQPALVSANRVELDPDGAVITLAVAPQTPASAGWTLSLAHNQTALLAPGIYGIDARIELSGAIEITDQSAFISLTRAAVA